MFQSPLFEFLVPTALLLIAVTDDLRSRKIHNKLLLILLPFVLFLIFLIKGVAGLKMGLISSVLALITGVPLNLAKFIGGGDLKLLVVFALTLHWVDFSYSFFYALPCAALLGIFKVIFDKEFKTFLFNLFFLFKFRKLEKEQLHTIPFSLALFFGWLGYFSLNKGFHVLF